MALDVAANWIGNWTRIRHDWVPHVPWLITLFGMFVLVTANLKEYCWWHHHVVLHELGWALTVHPDGTSQARSPSGKIIRSHSPPRRHVVTQCSPLHHLQLPACYFYVITGSNLRFVRESCIVKQDDGPVALVSSGSRGIGAAIVSKLAASGWNLSLGYHDDEHSARAAAQTARESGARVTAVRVDMTDSAQVTAWVRQAGEELGPVEAVVSCAGIVRDRPPALLQPADWRAVIDLDGMFHLCRAAVLPMMRQRSGRIVMVSSVVGVYGHAGDDLAAKPGIAGFVKALAAQVGQFGIQVNAVTPGPAGPETTAVVPERTHATLTETIALRRFGSAAEVADLVAFLLSDEAAEMTGTVLEVSSPVSA